MASPKESRLVLFSFVLLSITARILVNNGHTNMPGSNLHFWRKLGMPTRDPTASVVVGLCSYTRGYDLNWRLHASLRRVCSPDATTTKNCAMYMLLLCYSLRWQIVMVFGMQIVFVMGRERASEIALEMPYIINFYHAIQGLICINNEDSLY